MEANLSGTITAVNYYGANGLCARTAGSTSTFYQFDPQGNVAIRTNSSGVASDTSAFEPWGKEHAVATPSDPFGYNAQSGYYFDRETGLYYCDARYYDPSHGVWLTRDPAGFGGGSNLYGYCGGNPVGSNDPAGEAAGQWSSAWIEGGLTSPWADPGQAAFESQHAPAVFGAMLLGAAPCAGVCLPEAGGAALASLMSGGGAETLGTVATTVGIGAAAGEADPELPDQIGQLLSCPESEDLAASASRLLGDSSQLLYRILGQHGTEATEAADGEAQRAYGYDFDTLFWQNAKGASQYYGANMNDPNADPPLSTWAWSNSNCVGSAFDGLMDGNKVLIVPHEDLPSFGQGFRLYP